MRILMLPTYMVGVSYWRFEIPTLALRQAGHEVTILRDDEYQEAIKESGHFWNWLCTHAETCDLIHIGFTPNVENTKMMAAFRNKTSIPFVTDLDDDFVNVPTYNPGYSTFAPNSDGRRMAKLQLRISDGVSLSTLPLEGVMKKESKRTSVLGNSTWLPHWEGLPVDPHRADDKSVRLLITGGNGRYGDWQILKEPLEHLMAKYDGKEGRPCLRLFFLGGTPDWVGKWFQSRTEPLANRAFYLQPTIQISTYQKVLRWVAPDILASPVLTNAFNAAKSDIKAQEAAMCGAAFICTDWPTYGGVPKDACLKCDNTYTQWVESLSALIEDASLRKRLAQRARQWVVDERDAFAYISPRLAFYEEVLSHPPVSRLEDVVRPGG